MAAVIVLLQSPRLQRDNIVFTDGLYYLREKGLKDRYSGENSSTEEHLLSQADC